jgi:pimeloyl-ACP methyl ester carboxylesterase
MWFAAAAATLALCALVFLRARMRPRFSYAGRSLSDSDYQELASKQGWRAHLLEVAPGVELRGLLREPATPAGPWILFFGGNSAQLLREGQEALEVLCAGPGWGAALWAYRGFDSSGGTPGPAALVDDGFKAWSALLAERKLEPGTVHLAGFSLGTCIASAVAARALRNPPASLTLLAPMTRLFVGERTQLLLHRYETLEWLAGITSPVLVIHGARDAALNVENGRAVAKALGSRATLLEPPELGHHDLLMSSAAQNAMRAFIGQHAAGRPLIGPGGL